ncbi:MAG: DnaD domain protein [Clostridiaceae bacterium]|nr:DnaD domain protein [Clostridiaceae bacterium]
MRDFRLQFDGAALALPAAPAREICVLGDGDAALLYLYLLAHGGVVDDAQAQLDLKMTAARYESAARTLAAARAVAPLDTPPPSAPPPAAEPETYYTSGELDSAIRGDMGFAWLVAETEKCIGRGVWKHEAEKLMIIYDTLRLPPEVILLLVHQVCGEEPGRRPLNFSRLLSEARRWAADGINTVERAEEALRRDAERKSAVGQVLEALGIRGRSPSPTERRYINAFLDAGSSPELIARAYDITVTKKGSVNWAYTGGILERWRAKGLRTPEDVERYDRPASRRVAADADEDAYRRAREAYLAEKGEHDA